MEATVTTVGAGAVTTAPDAVDLDVAVVHRARSVADALSGCASAIDAVVATARELVSESAIATRGFDVDRAYGRDGREEGFVAAHALSIRCPGFGEAGDLVTLLGEAVGDRLRVDGLRPVVTEQKRLREQARELAFADAREKADQLAALAGHRVVGATRVVEGADGGIPTAFGVVTAAPAAATRFQPGTSEVSASLTITWSTAAV